RFSRLFPRPPKGRERKDFDVEAVWKRVTKSVRDVFIISFVELRNNSVNNRRINQWTIGRDPDNNTRGNRMCGLIEPIQNVLLRSSKATHAFARTKKSNRIVLGSVGCCHDYFVKQAGQSSPIDNTPKHGAATNVSQALARKSGRAHSGLNNRDNLTVRAFKGILPLASQLLNAGSHG